MNANNRRKKEYLLQYRASLAHEKTLEEQISQLRSAYASPSSQPLDGMPHASDPHDLSRYVAKCEEFLDELAQCRMRTIELRREITRRIESMDNQTEITILHLRYIHGYSFEKVAEQMHRSVSGIYDMHRMALYHFPALP